VEYLRAFRGVTVYRREQIPDAWHYKRSERVGAVLVLAHPGVQLFETPDSGG